MQFVEVVVSPPLSGNLQSEPYGAIKQLLSEAVHINLDVRPTWSFGRFAHNASINFDLNSNYNYS